MAGPSSLRASLRRAERLVPGGAERAAERERVAQLSARVDSLATQVDDLRGAVDRLHALMVDADPVMMREVVEALRSDVAGLVADVNASFPR